MSRNIVFEGWLTKSPPAKRIWRAKWRRRWFSLRQSGELPGQYFLDYYADRNCRRLKGTINLDLCEQVDAGLHMERGNGSLDPKLRGSVFTVRTQSRTYHLEAESEADMEKWVDAICRVCGLRATEDSSDGLGKYENNMVTMNEQYECADRNGPYIPISECITGVRAQNSQRAFTFDPQNIVTSNRMFERSSGRAHQMYTSQPHIRFNADFSENESNLSDEDCKSLNASQSHIGEWSVVKSFTKLAVNPKQNGTEHGPPEPPPRPPKTFTMNRDSIFKEAFHGPKIQEPDSDSNSLHPEQVRYSRRMSHCNSPSSPGRFTAAPSSHRCTDDEEDMSPGQPSLQYFNMPSLPPAVDRALKPRHSSHSIGYIHNLLGNQNFDRLGNIHHEDGKADVLQYLDLDLHSSKPILTKHQLQVPNKKLDIVHDEKPVAALESDSEYKTVDFLKTEAFNITRQDAEASRSTQH